MTYRIEIQYVIVLMASQKLTTLSRHVRLVRITGKTKSQILVLFCILFVEVL